jgi:hypothetical protein
MTFRVFTRQCWRKNPDWPHGYEPATYPMDKCTTVARFDTQKEARDFCDRRNKKWRKHHAKYDSLSADKRRVYFESNRYEFTEEL